MEIGDRDTQQYMPGLAGWCDIIRDLKDNPVYRHVYRMRARRYRQFPWYRRNPVVLLVVGLQLSNIIYFAITNPQAIFQSSGLFSSIYLEWMFNLVAVSSYVVLAWLVQAVYRYAHDCLGLLGRFSDSRGQPVFEDSLVIATLDNRVILAGAFTALFRAVLLPVILASLIVGLFNTSFYITDYIAYAPAWLPLWFNWAYSIALSSMSVAISSCLGTLLLGLLLVFLGCNLSNPRLQPIVAGCIALFSFFGWLSDTFMFGSMLRSPGFETETGLARQVLIGTALVYILMATSVLALANRFQALRMFIANLLPVGFLLLIVGPVIYSFFGYSLGIWDALDKLFEFYPPVLEYALVVMTAFNCCNTNAALIPVEYYQQINMMLGSQNAYFADSQPDFKVHLCVAWWYFPVLTAVQLVLAASLVRFAVAAVTLRRKAVQ